MLIFRDFAGRAIRLTDERLTHLLEHPEMQGQEPLIAETLLTPHTVIQSQQDSSVHVFQKLFDRTPVTRKYLAVMVKYLDRDAFIITAFFTDREKRGIRIWPR